MAEDVVQTVRLEGADQTAAGFDQVADAANKALKSIASGVQPTNQQLNSVGKHIENLTKNFVRSVGDVGSAAGKFVSNIGRMASSVTKFAAAAGLGAAALRRISAANKDQGEDVKTAIAQNRLQERGYVQAAQRARQYERQLRDLNRSFGEGGMSVADYSKAFQKLTRDRQEDEAEARQQALAESASAEARIREEANLRRQAAAQKAHAEAVEAYGADTASALQQLSPAWDNFLKKWNEGPSVIADIMRGIARLLTTHGGTIIDTLNRIGEKIANLFTGGEAGGSGDRAQAFAEVMMTAFKAVAGAVEQIIIPALAAVLKVFDKIAEAVNAVFGTKLSGGVLAVAAAFVVWSGALKVVIAGVVALTKGIQALLFIGRALAASQLFTPWGIAIAAVIVAIVLLIKYWDEVKAAVNAAIDAVSAKLQQWRDDWNQSVEQFKAAWQTVEGWWNELWTALGNVFNVEKWSEDFWATVKQFQDAWNSLVEWWTEFWTNVGNLAIEAWETLSQAASDTCTAIIDYIKGLLPSFEDLWKWLDKAVNWFKELIGLQQKSAAEGAAAGAEGMKRGGPIYGRGTSTSDSVPIWASRGEWVIRAQAAQYYGRRFMSMLNSMRLPRDFNMAALADGLMPGAPMARFATGGEVSVQRGSRVLNLTLPGLGSFNGLTGPDETMDRLQMAAVRSQLRSAGRLPGWYGGR